MWNDYNCWCCFLALWTALAKLYCLKYLFISFLFCSSHMVFTLMLLYFFNKKKKKRTTKINKESCEYLKIACWRPVHLNSLNYLGLMYDIFVRSTKLLCLLLKNLFLFFIESIILKNKLKENLFDIFWKLLITVLMLFKEMKTNSIWKFFPKRGGDGYYVVLWSKLFHIFNVL